MRVALAAVGATIDPGSGNRPVAGACLRDRERREGGSSVRRLAVRRERVEKVRDHHVRCRAAVHRILFVVAHLEAVGPRVSGQVVLAGAAEELVVAELP